MATHSSVLAWRIPGTGEPGGLPSVGLHRVRHEVTEKQQQRLEMMAAWDLSSHPPSKALQGLRTISA